MSEAVTRQESMMDQTGVGKPDRPNSPRWPLFLGCPVWSCDKWGGQVYPAKISRDQWLSWYTQTFNAVEGNSTFYALPSPQTARRWASESSDGFQFCFKFPQVISHQLQLVNADSELAEFLERLEPLAQRDRLGPTFLQMSPHFGPDRIDVLERFLERLPHDFCWAVELRHHDWFDSGENERRANELLERLSIDKVLFDSRPLYQSPPEDAIEEKSQSRKPKTPVRQTVTGRHPMLRIVGRNRVELVDRFFDQWAPIVAHWIDQGLRPFVFTHAPDDALAPTLARRFADRMSAWHRFEVPWPPRPAQQLSLLDDS